MVTNKKILVIDDEPHIRRVIELKLKKHGYEILTAANGEEGLNIITTQEPDVVISDINMPKMDGKTLCEMTDGLKTQRPFLTIIITARISPDEENWISKMHNTLFMEKPFSPARLLECVDQYFENQGNCSGR
ncbi:MAG: response regulator [Desulfobacteraceae bacterium]|nr:response regulator [Desulfobacteraceae bacterium]